MSGFLVGTIVFMVCIIFLFVFRMVVGVSITEAVLWATSLAIAATIATKIAWNSKRKELEVQVDNSDANN